MPISLELSELCNLLCASTPTTQQASSSVAAREIVIADRGWVFVGMATKQPDGDLTLTDAATVRVWGTTEGLGQLARSGPTGSTKLDKCGAVRIPSASVIARLACIGGTWPL